MLVDHLETLFSTDAILEEPWDLDVHDEDACAVCDEKSACQVFLVTKEVFDVICELGLKLGLDCPSLLSSYFFLSWCL